MAGKASPPPALTGVRMVNPDTLQTEPIHPDDVQSAAAQGWTVETPEESRIRQYQQTKGGSIAEGAKSFAEHALSSATLGGFDLLASQSPEYREARQNRDATFKAPALLGEAAGFLAPGIGEVKALGAAGKVIKTVAAPVGTASKLATRAGTAVERIAAGAAPGASRRLGAKALGGTVGGAVEGGLVGAGQALSEASIENKELTAELLLDHVKSGAAIGGVLGGSLGAGIELLTGGAKAVSKVPGVSDMFGGSRGVAGLAETKALTAFGALGSDIKRIVKEGGAEAPHRIGRRILEEAEFGGKGAMGRALRHDLESATELASTRVQHYGDELKSVYSKLDSTGERANVASVLADIDTKVLTPLRASKYGGDVGIARAIEADLEPLFAQVRKADDFRVSREISDGLSETYTKLKTAIDNKATISGDLLTSFEAEAKAARSQLKKFGIADDVTGALDDVTNSFRDAVRKVQVGGITGARQAARLAKAEEAFTRFASKLDDVVRKEGTPAISYGELWKLRQRVDKDVKNWTTQASPNAGAYRDLREALKDQIEAQVQKTGQAEAFRAANSGYADWIQVKRIAEQRAGSMAGNRSVGLTDTIMGIGGANLAGGPLGVVVGAGAIVGNKFIRSAAGDRVLATAANSFANWRKVIEASDNATQSLVKRTGDAIRTVPLRIKTSGFSTRLSQQYDREREQALARQENQEQIVNQLALQVQGVRDISPELADATVRAGARGNAYLASIAPTSDGYLDLESMAAGSKDEVSDGQKSEFLQAAEIVKHPTAILEKIADGTLTPAQVKAAMAASPALYGSIVSNAVDKLSRQAARGRIPDYQQRVNLSILTGIPLDASMRPEVIAAYQKMYRSNDAQDAQQAQAKRGPLNTGRKTGFGKRRSSGTEREPRYG